MVARGDLGVEVGPERVPALQKQIIQMANREAKPVITATEMLDSMIRSPRPTRAEASDVANAVFDGTDALMLSGETAAGRFPVEAVRTMARIIEVAESSQNLVVTPPPPREGIALPRVVSRAAVQVAADLHAKALLVFSLSGASVQLVSKFRPPVPLFGLCPREAPLRRLSLMWGTEGVLVPTEDNSRALTLAAERVCIRQGIASAGDPIVIVSGCRAATAGPTACSSTASARRLTDVGRSRSSRAVGRFWRLPILYAIVTVIAVLGRRMLGDTWWLQPFTLFTFWWTLPGCRAGGRRAPRRASPRCPVLRGAGRRLDLVLRGAVPAQRATAARARHPRGVVQHLRARPVLGFDPGADRPNIAGCPSPAGSVPAPGGGTA
jgi:hypothetical protein